jgi:hypothetical protein
MILPKEYETQLSNGRTVMLGFGLTGLTLHGSWIFRSSPHVHSERSRENFRTNSDTEAAQFCAKTAEQQFYFFADKRSFTIYLRWNCAESRNFERGSNPVRAATSWKLTAR